jgi:hypothetical protein
MNGREERAFAGLIVANEIAIDALIRIKRP